MKTEEITIFEVYRMLLTFRIDNVLLMVRLPWLTVLTFPLFYLHFHKFLFDKKLMKWSFVKFGSKCICCNEYNINMIKLLPLMRKLNMVDRKY